MKFEDLIRKNKNKLSQTDLYLAEFILNNKRLDLSIDELGKACLTSRTSVLRFAKKLGFKGYSELKFFVNRNMAYEKKTDINLSKNYRDIFSRLDQSENIFIYGNGEYEGIIKNSLKIYLKNLGFLSETYQGRDELTTFNEKSMKNSTIFVIDLDNDQYALELLSLCANIKSLKILVTDSLNKSFLTDFLIHVDPVEKNDLNLLSNRLEKIEDFFIKYKAYRRENEGKWANKRKIWQTW